MLEQKNTSADAGKAEAAALRSAVVRTAIEVAAMAAKITYGCPKALMARRWTALFKLVPLLVGPK